MALSDSDGFGRGSDSGGFGWITSSPAGTNFAVFYSLYGHFNPTGMDFRFGRIRSRVGFGSIRVHSSTPEMESANPGGGGDVHSALRAPRCLTVHLRYSGTYTGYAYRILTTGFVITPHRTATDVNHTARSYRCILIHRPSSSLVTAPGRGPRLPHPRSVGYLAPRGRSGTGPHLNGVAELHQALVVATQVESKI